mmetsp:Transcript_25390/g.42330  ORF Transcript_25390/g.42330 Transcript_25390/m.42330 type:complete len:81 (+) Transcript_25390:201-443(+)
MDDESFEDSAANPLQLFLFPPSIHSLSLSLSLFVCLYDPGCLSVSLSAYLLACLCLSLSVVAPGFQVIINIEVHTVVITE